MPKILRHIAAIAACLAALVATPVQADQHEVMATLTKFGIIHVWGQDCSSKPSEGNIWVTWEYGTDNNQVAYIFAAGLKSHWYGVLSAHVLAADMIELELVGLGKPIGTVVIKKDHGDIFTWRTTSDDGRTTVREGLQLATGQQTPRFHECIGAMIPLQDDAGRPH